MRALLLAAGEGSRLRPLTGVLPKCLVPVNGRPFLEYWFHPLMAAGIDDLLINTHHLADLVEKYIRSGPWSRRVRIVHEPALLGTGGTLLANRTLLAEEPFLLAHADNLCGCDFNAFVQAHRSRPAGTEITMMTFTSPTPWTCGIVELDERGVVRAFHEKSARPPGNLANGAVYIMEPSVIDFIVSLGKDRVDLSTEVLPHYIGKMFAWHNGVYHRDIGNIESYGRAQAEFSRALPEVADEDPWQMLLQEEGELEQQWIASLASALQIPAVPFPFGRRDQVSSREGDDAAWLAVIDQYDEELLQRLRAHHAFARLRAVLFRRVPARFLAARVPFLEGKPCFALCTAPERPKESKGSHVAAQSTP